MTALTDDDRALLRQVITHARAQGWRRLADVRGQAVAVWDRDGSLIMLERHGHDLVLDICGMTRIDVVSLRYAIDILVAAGVLPARMSSAYQAGRDAVLAGAAYRQWTTESSGVIHPPGTLEMAEARLATFGGRLMCRYVTPWEVARD